MHLHVCVSVRVSVCMCVCCGVHMSVYSGLFPVLAS